MKDVVAEEVLGIWNWCNDSRCNRECGINPGIGLRDLHDSETRF